MFDKLTDSIHMHRMGNNKVLGDSKGNSVPIGSKSKSVAASQAAVHDESRSQPLTIQIN